MADPGDMAARRSRRYAEKGPDQQPRTRRKKADHEKEVTKRTKAAALSGGTLSLQAAPKARGAGAAGSSAATSSPASLERSCGPAARDSAAAQEEMRLAAEDALLAADDDELGWDSDDDESSDSDDDSGDDDDATSKKRAERRAERSAMSELARGYLVRNHARIERSLAGGETLIYRPARLGKEAVALVRSSARPLLPMRCMAPRLALGPHFRYACPCCSGSSARRKDWSEPRRAIGAAHTCYLASHAFACNDCLPCLPPRNL